MFVTSDGKALPYMRGFDICLLYDCKFVCCEIGDISDEWVVEYLTDKQVGLNKRIPLTRKMVDYDYDCF